MLCWLVATPGEDPASCSMLVGELRGIVKIGNVVLLLCGMKALESKLAGLLVVRITVVGEPGNEVGVERSAPNVLGGPNAPIGILTTCWTCGVSPVGHVESSPSGSLGDALLPSPTPLAIGLAAMLVSCL